MKPTAIAVGTCVRVLAMNDPQAVPSDTLGTFIGSTDMGTWMRTAVRSDNSCPLALAVPPDRCEMP